MHFKRFELLIETNIGSPFLSSPSLTWADLAVFDILCTLDETAQLWTTPSTFFHIPEPNGPLRPPKELLKSDLAPPRINPGNAKRCAIKLPDFC